MPDVTTKLSPSESLDHIESYLQDLTDAEIPQSLRDARIARLALHERHGSQFTIRLGLMAPSRIVHYCDCHAEPVDGGSIVRYTLRGPWRPRTAALLVLILLSIQMVYELFTGTFDRVSVIIAIVVPTATALLAQLNNRMIRTKYRDGMMDVLRMSLQLVSVKTANSTDTN